VFHPSSYGATYGVGNPCQSSALSTAQKADCSRLMNKRKKTYGEKMRLKQYRSMAQSAPAFPGLPSQSTRGKKYRGGLPGLSSQSSGLPGLSSQPSQSSRGGWNPLRVFLGLAPSKKNDQTVSAAYRFHKNRGLGFTEAVSAALRGAKVPSRWHSHYRTYLAQKFGADVTKPSRPKPRREPRKPAPRRFQASGHSPPSVKPRPQYTSVYTEPPAEAVYTEPPAEPLYQAETEIPVTVADEYAPVPMAASIPRSLWYGLGAAAIAGTIYYFASREGK
jgi:hypothetical protein